MALFDKVKKQENLHIVFWLLKDSCWMLEIKWLGVLMVIPALYVAMRICYLTWAQTELFLNLAIFFWICANSFWMITEFFYNNEYKNLSGIPFVLGFIFVTIYYFYPGRRLT